MAVGKFQTAPGMLVEPSSSPLAYYYREANNHGGRRTVKIDTITIHAYSGHVNAQAGADAAQSQHHHYQKQRCTGENRRGSDGKRGSFAAADQNHHGDTGHQETQRLGGQEQGVQCVKIADSCSVQKLPGGFQQTGTEHVNGARRQHGKAVLGHLIIKSAHHQYRRNREKYNRNKIHQRHGY